MVVTITLVALWERLQSSTVLPYLLVLDLAHIRSRGTNRSARDGTEATSSFCSYQHVCLEYATRTTKFETVLENFWWRESSCRGKEDRKKRATIFVPNNYTQASIIHTSHYPQPTTTISTLKELIPFDSNSRHFHLIHAK